MALACWLGGLSENKQNRDFYKDVEVGLWSFEVNSQNGIWDMWGYL